MIRRGNLLSPLSRSVLLVFYMVFTLAPIFWLFISTIQTQASLLRVPAQLLPNEISLQNYIDIFRPAAFGESAGQSTFFLALRNSVIVTLGTTIVASGFGTLAGYAFARLNIPNRRTLLLIVLGSQLLPAISLIIPFFRMSKPPRLPHPLPAFIL